MVNRRANAVLFGFDFQINAAIILMLANIKDATSIRLEGSKEDIEIKLVNGHSILAQAKSVEKSSSDFRNVRRNLEKSLISLSEGAKKAEIEQLIFITNSPNPLGEDASRNLFCGLSRRSFSSLPDSSQKIITNYLKNEIKLDTSKFTIQVLPFETDDDKEKYKMVMQEINDFIGDIGITTPGIGKKLHEAWRISVFSNGTKKDETIDLTKKDFIWPIIVIETDIGKIDEHIIEEIDEAVLEEIIHRYKEIIDVCCERFEFVTRVLSDYNQFESFKSASGRCWEFAVTKWTKYAEEFRVDLIDDETLENLTKIVLYSIVKRRLVINSIKQGVGL